jgi:PAS domain S-box-containing protein
LALTRDITEHERAETELRLQAQALNQTHDAVVVTDSKGYIRRWNLGAERLYGYTAEEVVGKHVALLYVEADRGGLAVEIANCLREKGTWEGEIAQRHKTGKRFYIHLSLTALCTADGAAGGVIGYSIDVTERRQAEEELRNFSERLQALSRRLVQVQEEERRHLARELHDEIGQLLTGLQLILERTLELSPDAARPKLAEAQGVLESLLRRVRELSFDLRPALLDTMGLLPALGELFARYTSRTGVHVRFEHAELEGRLAPEIETAAYRIIQEALTNVARHAAVREAVVGLWADGGTLDIQIVDKGAGFDLAAALAGTSAGVAGMRERAELLGGQLLVESTPGDGTQVTARLPLRAAGMGPMP